MERIFISYKRVDKEKVFRIKDQIEVALNEKCWVDIDGIESDAQFANVIKTSFREHLQWDLYNLMKSQYKKIS